MQKREQEASVLQHIYNAMNLAYQHMCWNTFQGWAFQEMKAAADMTLCRIIVIQGAKKGRYCSQLPAFLGGSPGKAPANEQ
jgi:hypothetical protein